MKNIGPKTTEVDRKNNVGKRTLQHASIKRKKWLSASISSSISAASTITLADTDNSDYETMYSYYIAECLKDQEEKENVEPTEIPFGLSDIEYFNEVVKNVN
ncbi:unnamed protein product [Parnassius apollo]|uniref:(apollo) hypothetical protein n=1 Tax=Parnassius apollo TaxID=110799 RepID=A0A8S3YD41_PARAO|nr:unnamed protein product [Parnassius apollo]